MQGYQVLTVIMFFLKLAYDLITPSDDSIYLCVSCKDGSSAEMTQYY